MANYRTSQLLEANPRNALRHANILYTMVETRAWEKVPEKGTINLADIQISFQHTAASLYAKNELDTFSRCQIKRIITVLLFIVDVIIVNNIFNSKHVAINLVYEQFNTDCQ